MSNKKHTTSRTCEQQTCQEVRHFSQWVKDDVQAAYDDASETDSWGKHAAFVAKMWALGFHPVNFAAAVECMRTVLCS